MRKNGGASLISDRRAWPVKSEVWGGDEDGLLDDINGVNSRKLALSEYNEFSPDPGLEDDDDRNPAPNPPCRLELSDDDAADPIAAAEVFSFRRLLSIHSAVTLPSADGV